MITGLAMALLPLVVLAPLGVALLLALCPRAPGPGLAPLTALPAIVLAILPATPEADASLPFLLLGSALGLDGFSRVFLLFSSLLWCSAGVYARGYIEFNRQREFFLYFLLSMAGNLGLLVARDIVSFYALYALMSFASYGLIVHTRSEAARYAGRVYIAFVVAGELLLFPALLLGLPGSGERSIEAWAAGLATHPQADLVALLLIMGFGFKAGIIPGHVWLPLAHTAAPTPASAVLSGAMIKAGLFGLCVFLPVGSWASSFLGLSLMALGLLAAVCAALWGVAQNHPKALLAYSSVSKMGPMVFAVGAALHEPQLWPASATAIVIFAAYHGLTKGALFLSVGMAGTPPSAPWRSPWMLALLLPAMVFVGAPVTGGAIAKLSFVAVEAGLTPVWQVALSGALSLVAALTAILMYRFWLLLFRLVGHEKLPAPTWTRAAWLATVALCTGLPLAWLALGFGDLVRASLDPGKWPGTLLPLLGGLLLAGAVSRFLHRPMPALPPGDLLAVSLHGARLMARLIPPRAFFRLRDLPRRAQTLANSPGRRRQRKLPGDGLLTYVEKLEARLLDGPLPGTLMLLLFAAMILTLLS